MPTNTGDAYRFVMRRRTMWYGGREVPVGATILGRGDVPELEFSDRGERVGDRAVIDFDPYEWDGRSWVLAPFPETTE